MAPEKSSDDHIAPKTRIPTALRGSDLGTVVLLAASALGLMALALALTGHLLGR